MRAADRLSQYYKDLMRLSNECRLAHEQWDVNITKRSAVETKKDHPAFPNSDSTLHNRTFHPQANKCKAYSPAISTILSDTASSPSTSNCEELKGKVQEKLMEQKSEHSSISSLSTTKASIIEMKMADSTMSTHHSDGKCEPR